MAAAKVNRALFASLAPPLTEKDEKVVASLQKLIAFFAGELDGEEGRAAGAPAGQLATLDAGTVQRARAVLPVLQYVPASQLAHPDGADSPAAPLYVPAGHSVTADAPCGQ